MSLRNAYSLTEKKKYLRLDIAAGILGAALLLFFLLTANRGIALADEAFYFSVPKRLLQGDKLLVHEWGVQQLGFLFLVIPYRLFVALAHSTDGIMLFSRCLFVIVNTVMYFAVYIRLRRYGAAALVSAALFFITMPAPVKAMHYYAVAVFAVAVFVLMLCFGKPEKSRWVLFAAGLVFAVGVLAEPLLAVGYALYLLAAFYKIIRKKPAELFLNVRWCLYITLGTFTAFVLFMLMLALNGSLSALPQTVQYLVNSKGYSANDIIDLSKLYRAFRLFGFENIIVCFCCVGAAAYVCGRRTKLWNANKQKELSAENATVEKRLVKAGICIFALSCISFAACFVHAAVYTLLHKTAYSFDFLINKGVPWLLFPLLWYLLCEKRDRRLFCVWLVSFVSSVLIDVSSDAIMGIGGQIALIAGVLLFAALLGEIRREVQTLSQNTGKAKKRGVIWAGVWRSAAAICLSAVLLWNIGLLLFEGYGTILETLFRNTPVNAFSAEIARGPLKGLKTTNELMAVYDAVLDDMDLIQREDASAQVFIYGNWPLAYLYLDGPCSSDTAFFVPELETERQREYWLLFPEKKPEYVYFPFYDDFYYEAELPLTVSEFMRSCVGTDAYEVLPGGKAGTIVRVL